MSTEQVAVSELLERVADRLRETEVFLDAYVREGVLICPAKGAAAEASYRAFVDGGRVWVSLVMADRWLSESIEADLMHTGDKLEELLAEELAEQELPDSVEVIEHFRSDDLLFTFRTPIGEAGSPPGADVIERWLLAYESCFQNLGDMAESEE